MKGPSLPPYEYRPHPYQGPSFEEVMDLRKRYLNPALLTYYQNPIMIVEGSRQYVYDEKGRRYLDAIRRHRHHQCRPLPSLCPEKGPGTDGNPAAHHHDLSAIRLSPNMPRCWPKSCREI